MDKFCGQLPGLLFGKVVCCEICNDFCLGHNLNLAALCASLLNLVLELPGLSRNADLFARD